MQECRKSEVTLRGKWLLNGATETDKCKLVGGRIRGIQLIARKGTTTEKRVVNKSMNRIVDKMYTRKKRGQMDSPIIDDTARKAWRIAKARQRDRESAKETRQTERKQLIISYRIRIIEQKQKQCREKE